MGTIAGKQFSALAIATAQRQLRRKASGKKGRSLQNPFDPSKPLTEQQVDEGKRAFRVLVSIPANRRAITRGVGARLRAEQLGFSSLQEAQQFRGFAKLSKKTTKL